MSVLAWNRYGKSRIRLVKVTRTTVPHTVTDLTVDVHLEGHFSPVYTDGENDRCVATDTMKNTVYALARQESVEPLEAFALRIAAHFARKPHVTAAEVEIRQHRWNGLAASGGQAPSAFIQSGGEEWTTRVVEGPTSIAVGAGLSNLTLLKTANSSFSGFPRDEFTTLPDTDDRLLATSVVATWQYRSGFRAFSARHEIRRALIETFAAHHSRSVQHTLYAMADSALGACEDVTEITLRMPNRHHLLVDLTPFGLDNPNEIFVATDQPFGLIEATVRRG